MLGAASVPIVASSYVVAGSRGGAFKSADGGTVVSGDHGARSGHEVSGGESVRGPALELVSVLCRALEDAGVRYCHFKSNEGIELSASGENDLDLLVHRADTQRFDRVITGLGFKAVDYRSA